MIRIVLLLTVLSGPLTTTFAQTEGTDTFGKLAISVVTPDEQQGFSSENLSMLSSKLLALLTTNDIASSSIEDAIILYPVVKIYNEREIQPGLQKLTVIDGEMSLFIMQTSGRVVFANMTKKVQGSGRSHALAINNIISTIKTDDPTFDAFIKKARSKAISYYTQRCSSILAQADQLASTGKQEQALSLITSIPAEVPCFDQAKSKAIAIFLTYQARHCKEVIMAAKARFGTNAYREGFDQLKTVDPTSPCFNEATQLFNQNSKEVDENTKREWELLNSIYKNAFELEKYRYKAISELAVLYLASNPRHSSYDVLIR
ncbi:hypothetical protein GO755_21950 [Spirosoma sp. HMF4905]|uniref:Uncharacterized protein n=1 Tax=Spirosoma arboris TaxID=2682092 RepID=A0A7K1SFX3_9BACT|nr:hypothetical protein [Spirosoma arboris]MVM32720.1 hypothetical protein [Spirosoma arboris]